MAFQIVTDPALMDEYWLAGLLWCNPSRGDSSDWREDAVTGSLPSSFISGAALEADGYWSRVHIDRGETTYTTYIAFGISVED